MSNGGGCVHMMGPLEAYGMTGENRLKYENDGAEDGAFR